MDLLMYRKDKSIRDRKQITGCRGKGTGESDCLIGSVSLRDGAGVLELDNGDGCTTLGIY